MRNLKKKAFFSQYIKNYQLFLMLLPCLIFFIIFHYKPLYGLLLAFKDYKILLGIAKSPWVGLKHFEKLFGTNGEFVQVIWNTLKISILRLGIGFPAPILLAIMLNEIKFNSFKRIIQSVSYLPHFFSWVVLGGIVLMIFKYVGPVNDIRASLGLDRIEFLTSPSAYLFILILSGVWQSIGWGSIIYLAAISGINPELYSAALVDGANRFQRILHITIPSLTPTIITMFLLSLGRILDAGFDQIYNTYNPMVYESADIIDTYVLRRLQTMDFSLGTAAGLFKSVIGMTLILTSNKIIRKYSKNELGIF